jgi:hypothetical protein
MMRKNSDEKLLHKKIVASGLKQQSTGVIFYDRHALFNMEQD